MGAVFEVTTQGGIMRVVVRKIEDDLIHGRALDLHGVEAYGSTLEEVVRKLGERAANAIDQVA